MIEILIGIGSIALICVAATAPGARSVVRPGKERRR